VVWGAARLDVQANEKNQKRKKKQRTKASKINENWMPNWLLGLGPMRAPVWIEAKLKHIRGQPGVTTAHKAGLGGGRINFMRKEATQKLARAIKTQS